jgi:hypothetical protein
MPAYGRGNRDKVAAAAMKMPWARVLHHGAKKPSLAVSYKFVLSENWFSKFFFMAP